MLHPFGDDKKLVSANPQKSKILFDDLDLISQSRVFEFLDPKDLYECSLVSQKNREFMMRTKIIWIPLYKHYISEKLPEDMNLIAPLIEQYKNHFGIEEDEIERDRRISYKGIIQEEFLFAVFAIPEIVL